MLQIAGLLAVGSLSSLLKKRCYTVYLPKRRLTTNINTREIPM